MSAPKAVIFDMDGVIVDSEPLHTRAWEEVFEELGYGATHGLHFPDYYGKTDRALAEDFCARHKPRESLETILARKQRRLIELLRAQAPVFDGLPRLLEKLAPHYRLAIASGSTRPVIEEVVALGGLRRFFAALVSSTEVPHGKPAPDVFLRAAELLGVPPAACTVVEDSATGVEGALAAGMRVIAIANSLPPARLTRAHHVAQSYEEIARLLLPGAASCGSHSDAAA